jgi:hypothetical protein
MAGVRQLRRRARLNKLLEQLKADRAILLVCLGIALAFWLPTKMAQTYQTEKKVALRFQLPPNTAFVESPPQDMSVVVEGRGWDLLFDRLRSRQVNLDFTLANSRNLYRNRGQLRKAILDRLYSLDLKIVELNYDELRLAVEPILRKKVPVFFSGKLDFRDDYFLKWPLRIRPDSVQISGPESKIQRTESMRTYPKEFVKLDASFKYELPLALPREFQANPSKVTLYADIEKFTEKSLFVELQVAKGMRKIKYFPTKVKVTFQVGLSQFDQVNSSDFYIEAGLDSTTAPGITSAPLIIKQHPGHVRSIRMFPNQVDFLYVE